MTFYRQLFHHVLTRLDAEAAHRYGFRVIRAGASAMPRVMGSPVTAMGLRFPHALGLAAGFDKNAVGIDPLGRVGFGHVEIGTVTGEAQPGNPRPRLFRLPADRAIINRMGFNNDGAEAVARRLAYRAEHQGRESGPVLGINIGKTKVVPDEDAARDYAKSARLLAPFADYLVVNVSSPNTPGLRDLQAVDKLEPLLTAVRRAADSASTERRVPLLVKIAPDLDDHDVQAVADLSMSLGLDGIITTNTTIKREGLVTPPDEVTRIGEGGLSGPLLRDRALAITRMVRERVGPGSTIIGVGGITTVDDARARLAAGADLVQAYTAFVYEGPSWPRRILQGLARD